MEIALLIIVIFTLILGPGFPLALLLYAGIAVYEVVKWPVWLLAKAWQGFKIAFPWLLGAVLVWVIIIAPIIGIK